VSRSHSSWFKTLAALLALVGLAAWRAGDVGVRSFTIVHLNDVYEIFPVGARVGDTYEDRGGLAYVGTLIRQARQRGPVLVLHAGDFISPSLLSIKFKHRGAQMIDAMNAIGVDIATPGNHEFDLGCRTLSDRVRQSTFQWNVANVAFPDGLELPAGRVVPYQVVTAAGLRIGIFGLTLPLAAVRCDSGEITFRDPVTAAHEVVAILKRERVHLIVALTHLPLATDRALAAEVPDIDLIVGGHDHHRMVDLVGKTLIAKADANATSVGAIHVKTLSANGEVVVEKRWSPLEVTPRSIAPDVQVASALARYATELEPLKRTVGATDVPLDLREEIVREGESNFGNYIADLIRTEMRAEVAIINGGAVRGDRIMPAGALTLEDVQTALVFQDRLVAINVTGEQVRHALENGVSRAGERDGRFPQISGLSFTFDPDRPAGSRILQARIGGRPLSPQGVYRMATISFLTTPGNMDGYLLPTGTLEMGGELTETVLRHLATGRIKPAVEGRIVSLRQAR
jgi:2',3'-cyclic-nucleotide 2'-phosphodiesterase (5'-nucleotidase family)